MSLQGRDVPFCGTPLLPCKSLRYLTDKRMLLTHDPTIKVMHVEGKFMTCEDIWIVEDKNFKIVGINGTPIFNCSQNCKKFLSIYQLVRVEKRRKPSVSIKNLEIISAGCSDMSVITIFEAICVEIDSIVFKESVFPIAAILVSQDSNQSMNVTVHDSTFSSPYGILVTRFKNLFLMIDKSKFIGDGVKVVQGIVIKRGSYVETKETANILNLSIRSTCFRYLTGAVLVVIDNVVNFNMDIRKSQFTDNFMAPYLFTWAHKLRKISKSALCLCYIPNMVQKQIVAQFVDVVFQNNTSILGGAFLLYRLKSKISTKELKIRFIRCQFTGNQAQAGGAFFVWSSQFPIYFIKPYGPQVDGTLVLLHCIFENNSAINNIKQSVIKGKGGAIFCQKLALYISDTEIVNNYASIFAGALYDNGCMIHLLKTAIRIDERMSRLTLNGLAVYSRGKFVMKDVRIDIKKPILKSTEIPYIWMMGSQYSAIIPHAIPRNVSLTCSTENNIALEIVSNQDTNLTSALPSTVVTRLQFRCYPCRETLYSLASGRATLLNSSSFKFYEIKCNACPYGGDCSSEIKAKANF